MKMAINQYFITVEQCIDECRNTTSTIFFLATHYIFNMAYCPKTNDVLMFLQQIHFH